MQASQEIFIKYKENQPVPIEISYGRGPQGTIPLLTVAHLIAAYKTAVAPRFDSTPTDELTLHYSPGNGVEVNYNSWDPISGLGVNGKYGTNPLVVKRSGTGGETGGGGSPTSLKSDKALEKLNELIGVSLSRDEENILIKDFPDYLRLLKRGRLDLNGARHLHSLIKTTLKSQTIQSVRLRYGYVFGRTIDTGGGKTLLQTVFSLETGKILCAKVFLNSGGLVGSHSAVFESKLFEIIKSHDNIAPIVDTIRFQHESGTKDPLMALLMPLYSWSLANLLLCFREEPLPLGLFKQIAGGVLAAAARFQEVSYSHCDIKPNNIMMNGFIPVVIDFGAVVPLGNSIVEHTPFYALDANRDHVTSEFDLLCIVTTLVSCFAPKFDLFKRTKAEMSLLIREVCISNTNLNEYGNICQALLQSTSSMDALDRVQTLL